MESIPRDESLEQRLDLLETQVARLHRSACRAWGAAGMLALAVVALALVPSAWALADALIFYTRDAPAGVDKMRLVIPTDADPVTCRFENSSVNLVSGALQTAGTVRLTNAGGLAAITDYTQTTGTASITSSATAGTALKLTGGSVTTGIGLDVLVTGGATGSYAAQFSGGKVRLPLFTLAGEPPVASAAQGDLYYDSTNDRLRLFQPLVGAGAATWRNQGSELLLNFSSNAALAYATVAWTAIPGTVAVAADVPGLYAVTYVANRPAATSRLGLRLRDTTGAGTTRAHIQLQGSVAAAAQSTASCVLWYDKTTTTAESLAVQWFSSVATSTGVGSTLGGEVLNGLSVQMVRFGR